jgi:PAS domain S-box-containing protein
MREGKKISYLIAIMVIIVSTVAGMTLFVLYRAAVQEETARLVETAQSQARLIESMARHELKYFDHLKKFGHKNIFDATLEIIRDSHRNFEGFGKTGEFTLARIKDDKIVFLLRHRHTDLENPDPVLLSSSLAEPMRNALANKSGTIVGLDYRGEKVLAAHEPVGILNLGIVAKIDMSEIRSPFIRAGIISMSAALLLIFLGAALFLRIGNPIVHRLKQSEDFSERLVDAANALIITLDNNGNIESFNSFAEKFTGYSRSEVIGKNWISTFIPAQDHSVTLGIIKNASDEKQNISSFENSILVKGGEKRLISWNNANLKSNDGANIGVLSIGLDITEKSKMKEELLNSEKLESIGILAGGIAHDFNNILTAIMGNISLARMQTEDDPELRHLLTNAEKASARAIDLTQQLLTFSKGGAPILKTSSIEDIILETAQFSLRGSNVKPQFNIPDDLSAAELDVGQFSQVINNIVINADQAMPDGGVATISARNKIVSEEHGLPIKNGNYIIISISDNGVGIPEDNLKNIFDPFFTTKQRGNGLGLTSAYSIIRKHGGHIDVTSEVNVGTSFHIYIPASLKRYKIQSNRKSGVVTGTGKILVIDDEESIRKVAKAVLTKLGYDTCLAADGAEAITVFNEAEQNGRPIDAVIFDLTIPGGMGGLEAAIKLRNINPAIKTIVSSGYSNDPIMANFREYGFQGRVSKPYTIRVLSEVLSEVMSGSDVHDRRT